MHTIGSIRWVVEDAGRRIQQNQLFRDFKNEALLIIGIALLNQYEAKNQLLNYQSGTNCFLFHS